MININLDDLDDAVVCEAFHADGNEAEAWNDSYIELFELIGRMSCYCQKNCNASLKYPEAFFQKYMIKYRY